MRHKTKIPFALAHLAAFLLPAALLAQQPDTPPDQSQTIVQNKMQKVISVDFRDTPIDDVIRTLADQGQMDIIKSPKVTGNVTASISDVPLQEALDNILSAHNFGYIATDNMIRIVPRDEVEIQKLTFQTKVYRITYADVKEVKTALNDLISKDGSIAANPGTSNIIVTDTEPRIQAIDEFITEIDRITPQIIVEARIYDISSTDQLDVGVEWFIRRNATFDENGNLTGGSTDPFIGAEFESSINQTTKTSSGLLEFAVLNESLNLDAILHARQDEICAKLLANPRILVLDNETANIKIVSELPFQELTQTSGGGNIGTTEFKEVGVELEVTPHLTRDNMIRLKLRPKFSVQTGSVSIVVPTTGAPIEFPQPIVDTREAETTTLIRDGQVVVIGGLRKKDMVQEVSKIPLLGDIPLLGALFRFEGEKTVNSELVVFITPRIVNEPTLSDTELTHYQTTEAELCSPQCPKPHVDRCKSDSTTPCNP